MEILCLHSLIIQIKINLLEIPGNQDFTEMILFPFLFF